MRKWERTGRVPSSSDLDLLKASAADAHDLADDHSDRKSWRHAHRIAVVYALSEIVEGLSKLAITRKS